MLVPLTDVREQVGVRRRQPLHLLAPVAPLQRDDDPLSPAMHHDPMTAGVLPATEDAELGVGRRARGHRQNVSITTLSTLPLNWSVEGDTSIAPVFSSLPPTEAGIDQVMFRSPAALVGAVDDPNSTQA